MEEKLTILAFILLVLLVLAMVEISNRIKLKRQVKRNWGTPPRFNRVDKEESLKGALEKAKKYRNFDSDKNCMFKLATLAQ
ncbi:MAG: hypothetical protein LBM95_04430 [Lactobacillales bacterium]|jgi:hypothetical protein|nr:hypothetical protein [Lactobacillales bacterium]